jgi:hypothetical protein
VPRTAPAFLDVARFLVVAVFVALVALVARVDRTVLAAVAGLVVLGRFGAPVRFAVAIDGAPVLLGGFLEGL